jgi:hypothetical protein
MADISQENDLNIKKDELIDTSIFKINELSNNLRKEE